MSKSYTSGKLFFTKISGPKLNSSYEKVCNSEPTSGDTLVKTLVVTGTDGYSHSN